MKKLAVMAAVCIAVATVLIISGRPAVAAKLGLFQHHKDIGIAPKHGAARFDKKADEYFVTGGGANMWASADAFQFVYRQISGDVVLTADIRFEGQGVEAHRKAALMIRQSLASDSAYADAAVHGSGLTSLQYRPSKGAITLETRSEIEAPTQVRIERRGDQFTMWAGKTGGELKSAGPVTVHLQDPVYIGLAVCSHNASVLETALFSNLKLERP